MAGYAHYKNSKVAVQNFEPLYNTQWNLVVTPPPSINDWDLVIEGITSVAGLETNKMPGIVTQRYKGTERSFLGGFIESTTIDLTMNIEVNLNDANSAVAFKELRKWCDLGYDPLTGRFGLKKNYIGGPAVLSAINKEGDIYHQWIFPTIFPTTAIPAQTFDYDAEGIYKIEGFAMRADYWEEIIL